ncbi:hypothetical protein ALC62_06417 [Cyphomyrmex costatus]|uniref:Uncharacterized protein n=1 Tax=Cyphomyrmex costatus TaxID=456900 RepID=A0A195CPF3_9HYME|nr:hypothetical protein ALC62_06417 [Cyphomyrmex costatus]
MHRCEEATEVETHHQQTAATTMGVAEDETPSSLTSSHPNTNNPNQEALNSEWSKLVLASSNYIQALVSFVTSKGTFPQLAIVNVLKSETIVWKFNSRSSLLSLEARELHEESNRIFLFVNRLFKTSFLTYFCLHFFSKNIVYLTSPYGLLTYFLVAIFSSGYSREDKIKNQKINTLKPKTLDLQYYYVSENISMRTASCSVVGGSIRYAWLCIARVYSRKTGLVTDRKRDEDIGL